MPPCPVPDAFSLPGLALIASMHVLDRLVRRIGAHLEAGGIRVDERERLCTTRGVELGQALPVHHRDLDGDEADRVAVRRRLRDRAVADDAVAAGAVDDVDGLAEILLEIRGEEARDGIGAAAGAPRNDHRDRTVGICGERARGERREQCGSEQANDTLS